MIERVEAVAVPAAAPRHVAIIMDGNRRWAADCGLPPLEGHRRGMLTLRRIVATAKADIGVLTVHAFSEDNWQRSAVEVAALMDLGAAIALREAVAQLERRTAAGTRMTLNLAVDFGARSELCAAVRTLVADVAAGRPTTDAIDEDAIAGRFSTAGLPDPDPLIRTGGDLRLSNFLLYQCAYTELWSTQMPWPQFDARSLNGALEAYAQRQRRFGK